MAAGRDVRRVDSHSGTEYRFFWFSELPRKVVRSEGARNLFGRLSDIVFRLAEPRWSAPKRERPGRTSKTCSPNIIFRMIPIVDVRDRLPGIIRYNDLVQNLFDQKA
jgi:hypothetical protein